MTSPTTRGATLEAGLATLRARPRRRRLAEPWVQTVVLAGVALGGGWLALAWAGVVHAGLGAAGAVLTVAMAALWFGYTYQDRIAANRARLDDLIALNTLCLTLYYGEYNVWDLGTERVLVEAAEVTQRAINGLTWQAARCWQCGHHAPAEKRLTKCPECGVKARWYKAPPEGLPDTCACPRCERLRRAQAHPTPIRPPAR